MYSHNLHGYGDFPRVITSVRKIPYDQTSDFVVNERGYSKPSGAVHLIGNATLMNKKDEGNLLATGEVKAIGK